MKRRGVEAYRYWHWDGDDISSERRYFVDGGDGESSASQGEYVFTMKDARPLGWTAVDSVDMKPVVDLGKGALKIPCREISSSNGIIQPGDFVLR